MPIFEIETDQGTFEIDADKEPTQAEALQAIAGLSQPKSKTPEFDQFRQQYIQEAQSPVSALPGQALDVTTGLLKTIGGGVSAIPSAIDRRNAEAGIDGLEGVIPYTPRALTARAQATGDLLQSISEGLVQGSFDLARMPVQRVESLQQIAPTMIQQALTPPAGTGFLPESIQALATAASLPSRLSLPGLISSEIQARMTPRTPSEQEILDAFQISNREQALQQEFSRGTLPQVLGEAQPGATEFIRAFGQPENIAAGAVARALGPSALRAAQNLPSRVEAFSQRLENIGTQAPIERNIRTAIKPSAKKGDRVESASKNTINEIFHNNPNADELGSMPFEGFTESVIETKTRIGKEIGSAKGTENVLDGDVIAGKIDKEVARLEKSLAPQEDIDYLKNEADRLRGQKLDWTAGQDLVTRHGRKQGKFYELSRAAQGRALTEGETLADMIISREGGEMLNKSLGQLKGERGQTLRKTWSDLTVIEDEATKRLNTLINQAPPQVRNSLISTFTSTEGLAGLATMVGGWKSGGLVLLGKGVKDWMKSADKLLKDSNSLIKTSYERLRENPPPRPAIAAPPIIPDVPVITPEEALNQRIRDAVEASQTGEQFF